MRIFRRLNFYISLATINNIRTVRALIARVQGRGAVSSVRVLLISDDKILLVRHYLAPGLWMIPGGRIDERESPEIAAKREVKEETGLNVESFDGMIGAFETSRGGESHVYYTTHVNGTVCPTVRFEIMECKWFPLKNIPEEVFNRDKKHVERYLNLNSPTI